MERYYWGASSLQPPSPVSLLPNALDIVQQEQIINAAVSDSWPTESVNLINSCFTMKFGSNCYTTTINGIDANSVCQPGKIERKNQKDARHFNYSYHALCWHNWLTEAGKQSSQRYFSLAITIPEALYFVKKRDSSQFWKLEVHCYAGLFIWPLVRACLVVSQHSRWHHGRNICKREIVAKQEVIE